MHECVKLTGCSEGLLFLLCNAGCDKVSVLLTNGANLGSRHTLENNRDVAVGILYHVLDLGNHTHLEKILACGILASNVLLGNQENLRIVKRRRGGKRLQRNGAHDLYIKLYRRESNQTSKRYQRQGHFFKYI